MHGELLAQGHELARIAPRIERDQNADLAEVGRDRVVHVGCDHARRDGKRGRTAHRHVLADLADQRGKHLRDGSPALEGRAQQAFEIAFLVQRLLRGLADEALKLGSARDEIGFRIDLDDGAAPPARCDSDKPIGGDAAGFLGRLRQTLLAQPVDRGFDIAAGLAERRFAIHHARARLVAQVLHHAGRDRRHANFLTPRMHVQ